jgi:hypothetical protein
MRFVTLQPDRKIVLILWASLFSIFALLLAACGDVAATSTAVPGATATAVPATTSSPTQPPTRAAIPLSTAVPPTVTTTQPKTTAAVTVQPTATTALTSEESFKLGTDFQLESGKNSVGPDGLKLEFMTIIEDYRCGRTNTNPVTPGVIVSCTVDSPASIKMRATQNQQTAVFTLLINSTNRGGSEKTPLSQNQAHFGDYSIRLKDLLYQPCNRSSLSCPYFATLLVEKSGPFTFQFGSEFGLNFSQGINGPEGLRIEFSGMQPTGVCPNKAQECAGVTPPQVELKAIANGKSKTMVFPFLGSRPAKPGTADFEGYRIELKEVFPVNARDASDYLVSLVVTKQS